MSENKSAKAVRCFLCGGKEMSEVAHVRQKPARETDFGVQADRYSRRVYQCKNCSVYINAHEMLNDNLYGSAYNAATYQKNLLDVYRKIRALPEEKSDNKQRVRRVADFLAKKNLKPAGTNVLDVGSGLCVFLGEMKERGFQCYCIDPDPLSTRHALDNAKVDGAFAGTLEKYSPPVKFDLIAFNKVLEHVVDPAATLSLAKPLLKKGGSVYVELPDGESALKNGGAVEREEFYIEHNTVFTKPAFRKLAELAGLKCSDVEAVHEPSDKYTLYAFLS
jgi:SAM-dependent methyltransferase